MKTRSTKKLLALTTGAALSLVLGACSGGASEDSEETNTTDQAGQDGVTLEEPVTWTAVSYLPLHFEEMEGVSIFLDEIEERFDGMIEIDYLGADEAIGAFEQPEALRAGTVDMIFVPTAYPEGAMPIAPALDLSLLTPQEEREEGVYDMWREVYEADLDAVYLGRFQYYAHHLHTNFEVNSLEDFAGKTMRASPAQRPLVESLGGSATVMPGGDIYTALERGTIDGFGWPSVGVIELGTADLFDYKINPGFYGGGGPILLNATTFSDLPQGVQEEVLEVGRDVEEQVVDHYVQMAEDEERRLIEDHDVDIIELDESDAEEYLTEAYESQWERMMESDPEQAQKFKEATYDGREMINPISRAAEE